MKISSYSVVNASAASVGNIGSRTTAKFRGIISAMGIVLLVLTSGCHTMTSQRAVKIRADRYGETHCVDWCANAAIEAEREGLNVNWKRLKRDGGAHVILWGYDAQIFAMDNSGLYYGDTFEEITDQISVANGYRYRWQD